jgi:hypothetical protein
MLLQISRRLFFISKSNFFVFLVLKQGNQVEFSLGAIRVLDLGSFSKQEKLNLIIFNFKVLAKKE